MSARMILRVSSRTSSRISRPPLTAIDFYEGIQYHLGYFTIGEPVPGEGEGEEWTGSGGRSQQTLRGQLTAMDFYSGKSWFGGGAVDSPFALWAKGKSSGGKFFGSIIKGLGSILR